MWSIAVFIYILGEDKDAFKVNRDFIPFHRVLLHQVINKASTLANISCVYIKANYALKYKVRKADRNGNLQNNLFSLSCLLGVASPKKLNGR